LHFPECGRQLYPFALQGYLNLVTPHQMQRSAQIFRDHDSPGIVNGSSHTIKHTEKVGQGGDFKGTHAPQGPSNPSLSPPQRLS
jgi:hypothetical protein